MAEGKDAMAEPASDSPILPRSASIEKLIRDGITAVEAERLLKLKLRLYDFSQRPRAARFERLNFARWLFLCGRISG